MRARSSGKGCLAALCVAALASAGAARAQQPVDGAIAVPPLPGAPVADLAQLPPPPTVTANPATVEVLPNRKLARILCGALSIRDAVCHYENVSGVVTTYYPSGSVAESLTFASGLLEGLAETYDPSGHLLSRRLYHLGQPQEVGQRVGPVTPTADPPLPPPQPVTEPSTQATATKPIEIPIESGDYRGLLGIGASLDFAVMANRALVAPGIGGLLHVLPNTGRLRPELRIGALYLTQTPYRRVDVPLLLGFQWDLFASASTLYLGAALLTQYSHRFLPDNIPGQTTESGWFVGGEGAAGVRIQRSSQSYWLIDVRMGGSGRVDSHPQILLPQTEGPPLPAMGSQFQLLLGFAFIGIVGT